MKLEDIVKKHMSGGMDCDIGLKVRIENACKEHANNEVERLLRLLSVRLDDGWGLSFHLDENDEFQWQNVVAGDAMLSIESVYEGVGTKELLEYLKFNDC